MNLAAASASIRARHRIESEWWQASHHSGSEGIMHADRGILLSRINELERELATRPPAPKSKHAQED